MAKVINLRVENILGLKGAEAELNGESAVIGGMNGQGKSSLQRALKMALGGKEFVPAEPVHKGADKGQVFTVLDNGYEVEFSVTKDRKTKLTIRHAENPAFKSDSVTLLKSLFGDLSFDPGDCMAKGPKELAESLMRLAGLDFTELNRKRAELFEERTGVGRDEKRLAGQVSGLAFHKDAPAEEVSVEHLAGQLQEAQDAAREKERLLGEAKRHRESLDRRKERAKLIMEQIRKLQAELAECDDAIAKHRADGEDAQVRGEAVVVPDVEGIQKLIAEADGTNRKVRENAQRAKVQAEHKAAADRYAELTADIDRLDAEKREKLAVAKLPIEGLSFDETGVRFNEVPLADCSESERWEIATAIAFALNPGSIVFMSQSGGLDKRTRARVLERASQLGVQLLLEVVDDAEDVQILIERGEVVENRLQEAAA